MKVTLERRRTRVTREHGRARYEDEDENSDENDDDEVDIQVVEFWKRMGFEDIAEVFQKNKEKIRENIEYRRKCFFYRI